MPAAKTGESKQALIVTLVFFILLSLILGIFTYLGYSGQDQYLKDKQTAENNAKQAKADYEAQRTAAILLRSYMGYPPAKDKDEVKLRHDELVKLAEKGEDKDGSVGVLKKLDTELGWDAKQGLPANDFVCIKADLEKRLKDAADQLAQKETELKQKEDEAKKARATRDAFEQEYKKKLDELNAKASEDLKKYDASIAQIRESFGDSGKKIADLKEEIDRKAEESSRQLKKRDKDIKDMQAAMDKLEDKRPQVSALAHAQPKGKIVLMDKTGQMPYVNLGSADHIKPQITFSIHGVGADGKPLAQSKGSLEIVHVINERLSQARVTEQKDPARDPITTGDVLVNAAWNPDQPTHVAIVGIVDLTGDVRADRPADVNRALDSFKRSLENKNIVVDAWLDFTDNSIKGKGMTRQTDFLIFGDLPEERGVIRKEEGDARTSQRDAARTQAAKMADEAKKLGVQVVKLRDFLNMTGYRLPRTSTDNNLRSIHSSVPAAGSPIEKSQATQPRTEAPKEK